MTDWNLVNAALAAQRKLDAAGHFVTEADRVPGLFDVAGIARDVTIGQLIDIAGRLPEPENKAGNYR